MAPPIEVLSYSGENELQSMMALVDKDLSEPYSVFTYRYFLHGWPQLCFIAKAPRPCECGAEGGSRRHSFENGYILCGYIAMLAVDKRYRKHGLGTALSSRVIAAMRDLGCAEVVLETEVTNAAALRLYEKMGFLRDDRLLRYYLNGVDAFRLKLWL
ncbi:unnamed protein product [Phaeothamnion confervicola]